MGGFSLAKSNFRQLLLPNLKRFWFPKETKPLPSGLKKQTSATGEIQPGCEAVPCSSPQPTLKGKEGNAGGKGQSPALPTSSRHRELGGPGLRLLVYGYDRQLRWRFNGRCFKAGGSKALPCPVQSSCVSWQLLGERGAPEMVCPTPSYQQEHLWASPSTQSPTLPHDFSLALQYVSSTSAYQCVSCIWSGWT